MIYIKIELWPRGNKDRARLLQEMTIANDGTGDSASSNYVGVLSHSTTYKGSGLEEPNDPPPHAVFKRSRVTNFSRRLSPTRLLARMLANMNER